MTVLRETNLARPAIEAGNSRTLTRANYDACLTGDRTDVAPVEGPVDLAVMLSPIDPAELTLRLMSIDSTSGQEGDVIAWLDGYLVERGWRTWRIPVTPGRDDLFATVVEH